MDAEVFLTDDDLLELDKPELLAASGMSSDAPNETEMIDALREGPVMAGSWWNVKTTPIRPTMLPVDGGTPLLYPGMSHVFIGEPGRGKSMIGQWLCISEARAGRTCLFIDLEKNLPVFIERLKAMGCTEDEASRIGYWRLTKSFSPAAMERINAFAQRNIVGVIVIDSVGRAVSRAGLDENNNNDVRTWYDTVVDPMSRWGSTPAMIDHVPKPNQSNGEARYAKGAGAKLDVITGAAYLVRFAAPFSKEKAGFAKVIVAKDNNGERAEGELAAEMHVTPHHDGAQIEIKFSMPTPTAAKEFRPTVIMERFSDWLRDLGQPVSWRAAREAPVGSRGAQTSRNTIDSALRILRDEGFIAWPEKGKISFVKPYRQADDPKSEKYSGATDDKDASNEWF